jgi:hypothetical protein
MPGSTPNPYAPPVDAKHVRGVRSKRQGLGVALYGFLILQIVVNLSIAAYFLFAMRAAQVSDPLAPAWSFPVRAAFSIMVAATCVALLRRKRAALYVYFMLLFSSLPLNLARGLTSVPTLVLSTAVPAAIVAVLVRKKTSQFS